MSFFRKKLPAPPTLAVSEESADKVRALVESLEMEHRLKKVSVEHDIAVLLSRPPTDSTEVFEKVFELGVGYGIAEATEILLPFLKEYVELGDWARNVYNSGACERVEYGEWH